MVGWGEWGEADVGIVLGCVVPWGGVVLALGVMSTEAGSGVGWAWGWL